jgi:predicted amidophosphoribosyltransferase
MPTVAELSDLYANFMLGPRPGPGVCEVCFTFTGGDYARCLPCARTENHLDLVAPISYSVGGAQLHHALAGYKRLPGPIARRVQVELAAVLWRFLAEHEACVARAAGTRRFGLVTTVPSSDPDRDAGHPLQRIVGDLVTPTRERYEHLLTRSPADVAERSFSAEKYAPKRPLAGEAVLLIDDTWTTGANAQSAAAALRRAGAGTVVAVVIGRHVNRGWRENATQIGSLERPFNWSTCAWHAPRRGAL